MNKIKGKATAFIELLLAILLLPASFLIFYGLSALLHVDGLWVGLLAYALPVAVIIIYVGKQQLPQIGLIKIRVSDLPKGLLLGLFMFAVQQIPLLLIGTDYSIYAQKPDWQYILLMSAYCIFCVGFGEELLVRGFILHRTGMLCSNKMIAVVINCVIFYILHWPPVRFVFGEFFSTSVNTVLLCLYFYKSKTKSLIPLIIAHGFYDILTSFLMPAVLYFLL